MTVRVHQMKLPILSKNNNNGCMCMRVVENLFRVNTILHIKLNVPYR